MTDNEKINVIEAGNYSLKNCQRINIIFGKNGCGKSTALKKMATNLQKNNVGLIRYITPERGGILTYQPNVDSSMQTPGWSQSVRSRNQFNQFKEQTVVIFKDLRAMVNENLENYISDQENVDNEKKEFHGELSKRLFRKYIAKINSLLDNIEIKAERSTFKAYSKDTGEEISSDNISSGESELVTLAIECLAYDSECEPTKTNILFLDEPDVHIHPDLQGKLMHFLKELVDAEKFIIVIATHSTAILGALENYSHVGFNFITTTTKEFYFQLVSQEYKDILPIFGAHPLTNVYCKTPIFLVEGEDDVWIWQKAIKTSGILKIFPCETDGIDNMVRYEAKVGEILQSVYDKNTALAYSLRDRDDEPEDKDLDDYGKLQYVKRFMLSCRCAENLVLSDDVLSRADTNWENLQDKLNYWLEDENNKTHIKYNFMLEFKAGRFNRKHYRHLKEIINIIAGIITTKPWQVIIGQAIGESIKSGSLASNIESRDSLASYLGKDLVAFLEHSCVSTS